MNLVYLYVQKFKAFRDAEFNFEPKLQMSLQRTGESPYLQVERRSGHDRNFYSISRKNRAIRVNAIVGSNGAGKTSIAVVLEHVLSGGRGVGNFIVVYEDRGEYFLKYRLLKKESAKSFLDVDESHKSTTMVWDDVSARGFCAEKFKSSRIVEDDIAIPEDVEFVYYSPTYTSQHELGVVSSNIRDISTSALLKVARNQHQNTMHQIYPEMDAFKSYEYYDTINALAFAAKMNTKKCESVRKWFPVPAGFSISYNEDIGLTNRSYIDNQLSLYVKTLGSAGPKKRLGDKEIVRLKDRAKRLHDYARNVLDSLPSSRFLYAVFVTYVANYWRDNNGVEEMKGAKGSYGMRLVAFAHFLFTILKGRRDITGEVIVNFLNKKKAEYGRRLQDRRENRTLLRKWVRNIESFVKTFEYLMKHVDSRSENSGFQLRIAKRATYEDIISNFLKHYIDSKTFTDYLILQLDPHLSTGEMALLSLWGRVYRECEKIREKNTGKRSVILFLDEAETTLHPSLQCKLVWLSIWFFEKFFTGFSVQIVFATHSPMLLSDVAIEDVLFLSKPPGETESRLLAGEEIDLRNTFSANIFDLYRSSFFMKDGTVGEFAKEKVNAALRALAAHIRNNLQEPRVLDGANGDTLKMIGDAVLQKYIENVAAMGML